jgi:hypothetical protein
MATAEKKIPKDIPPQKQNKQQATLIKKNTKPQPHKKPL